MKYNEGYVYHIKDSYFTKANDDKLMENKESGKYRPTYYCFKDNNTSLLWVIPMSSQIKKYKKIEDQKIEKYGESIGVYIGKYNGSNSVFLIQNMFPITEKYIDHIHTVNGNPVPVSKSIAKEIKKRFNKTMALLHQGKNVVFPDVKRLEQLMLEEIKNEKIQNNVSENQPKDVRGFIKKKAQEISKQPHKDQQPQKDKKKNDQSL